MNFDFIWNLKKIYFVFCTIISNKIKNKAEDETVKNKGIPFNAATEIKISVKPLNLSHKNFKIGDKTMKIINSLKNQNWYTNGVFKPDDKLW